MFPPRVIWKSDRKAPPTKEWKTSYEREEKSTFREKFWGGKQLCDSLGKHREKCRYPAAGPEEPSAGCSYSREYESTLRGCNVLPSSLHRMFATAESAAEQQRGGRKEGKALNHLQEKKKETSSQKQEVQVIFLLTCQHKTRLTATKCSSLVLTVSYFLLNQEITPVLRGDRSLIIRCNSNWPEQLSLGRGRRAHQNDASWRNAEYQS